MITEFELNDYDSVTKLWDDCGLVDSRRAITRKKLQAKSQRDGELFLVYEADGKIVGTVMGGWDGWRGWIYNLAVAKEYRRKGIGVRLVDEVTKRLGSLGARRISAFVVSKNDASLSLFKKNGFKPMDNIVVMRLNKEKSALNRWLKGRVTRKGFCHR